MHRILVAEDSAADVFLIREALREYGIDCQLGVVPDGRMSCGSCSDVESSAEIQDLGLIIVDLNLPMHDGIEILRHLRATSAFSHVPVVVLTSSDSPRNRKEVNELGAACYLSKPSSLEQF